MKPIEREILLSFWKVHILHHAEKGLVYGQWITEELRRHGYAISPGTLYPLLVRMEARGWVRAAARRNSRPRERRNYRLTRAGSRVLEIIRAQVIELYREVVVEKGRML